MMARAREALRQSAPSLKRDVLTLDPAACDKRTTCFARLLASTVAACFAQPASIATLAAPPSALVNA